MHDLSDAELVQHFLEATEQLSAREAADRTGLSYSNIGRYRRGAWTRLQPATRRIMVEFLEERAAQQARAAERLATAPRPSEEIAAFALLGSMDQVKRYVQSLGAPGERRSVKRVVLDGIRTIITATDPIPEWWEDIVDRVERGDL